MLTDEFGGIAFIIDAGNWIEVRLVDFGGTYSGS